MPILRARIAEVRLERPVGLGADRSKAGVDRDRVTAAARQIRMLRRREGPRRVVGRPDKLIVVDEEVLEPAPVVAGIE